MTEKFDVVVIGSGPGGYAAAIRCAQNGASVAVVEKGAMGGTCLNIGCIPSKALLASVHFLTEAKHAHLMGVEIEGQLKVNWPKMISRKDAIVKGFQQGVAGLLSSNKVKVYQGRGIVEGKGQVRIEGENGTEQIEAKNIILATGSVPVEIPAFKFDGEVIISSTEALSLGSLPESMVIIGGGYIGCEMGCIYAAAGTKVTIVEMLEQLVPHEDEWVGKTLAKELKKIGIDSFTGKKVTGVEVSGGKAKVSLDGGENFEVDKVLVAVGRKAVCDKETVEALGLETGERGEILVNKRMETNVEGVYAIGDAVGTTYLAHGAFWEAEIAAANIAGHDKEIGEYSSVPRAIYTFPEVASVGKSEKKCAEEGIETEVGRAMFRTNGRSVAHNQNVGEVRIIRKKGSREIVGVTMLGAMVTEMIPAARALLGSTEEITDVSFPHPTVSEVLKEAWEDAFGLSIHVPPKRKS